MTSQPSTDHLIGPAGILPLLILLAMGITLGTTQPPAFSTAATGDSDWFRQACFGSAYLLSVVLALGRLPLYLALARRTWLYLALSALVLASATWSLSPEKAATNFVHSFGLFFVCASAALYAATRPSALFQKVQTFSMFVLLASIAVVVVAPQIGLEGRLNEYTPISGRWKGILGHANGLGIFAAIAACTSLEIFYSTKSGARRFFSLCTIATSLVVLVFGCRSMTSTLSILPIIVCYPFLMSMQHDSPARRGLKLFTLGLLVGLALLITLIIDPDILGLGFLFKSIGRSRNLTGRTALWQFAFTLVSQKPLLGWSFDSLASVLRTAQGAMPYGQFHNGYIDIAVRGGFVGLGLLLLMIRRAVFSALRLTRTDFGKALGLLAMFGVVCISNFAEASFAREGTALWFLFLTCWMCAEVDNSLSAEPPHTAGMHQPAAAGAGTGAETQPFPNTGARTP